MGLRSTAFLQHLPTVPTAGERPDIALLRRLLEESTMRIVKAEKRATEVYLGA